MHLVELSKTVNLPKSIYTSRNLSYKYNAADIILEYFEHSSVHGIRYIARRSSNMFERLLWLTTVAVAAGGAVTLSHQAWARFWEMPTRTVVATTHLPFNQQTFPAVTLCPVVRLRKTLARDLLLQHLEAPNGTFIELEEQLLHAMNVLALLQYPFYFRIGTHITASGDLLDRLSGVNLTEFMLQVFPTCDDFFSRCFWKGREVPCCEIFHLQRTEAGFCYSFNSLTSENTKHCNYSPHNNDDPACALRRNPSSGINTGLSVMLKPTNAEDPLPGQRDRGGGTRVLVQQPSQLPEAASKGLLLTDTHIGQVLNIQVSPSVTTCTDGVRRLSPKQRSCIFPDEKKLRICPIYSHHSCLVECRLRHLDRVCRCQPYFFGESSGNVPVCNTSQLYCIFDHHLELRLFRPPVWTPAFGLEAKNALYCPECLPSCIETVYRLKSIFSPDLRAREFNGSIVDIHYEGLGSVLYRTELSFSTLNLLVSVGTIAALFLGLSVLSVVEIIFYVLKVLSTLFIQKMDGNNILPASENYAKCMIHDRNRNIQSPVTLNAWTSNQRKCSCKLYCHELQLRHQ